MFNKRFLILRETALHLSVFVSFLCLPGSKDFLLTTKAGGH
jgi:hypothetical protein